MFEKVTLQLIVLIIFCNWLPIQTNAQQAVVPAEKVLDPAQLKNRNCDFDPGANAVVLFHTAVTENDDYKMVTTHRKRIQILNKNGLDEANISLEYYAKDDLEYITGIAGETANAGSGGFPVWTDLDPKSVFTEKIDNNRSRVKIVMPNVVEGSVFEIRWRVVSKSYNLLDYWDFQGDLPVEKSAYLLEILPGAEFAYSVQNNPNYPIIIKPLREEGKIYFEMNKVPALEFEPYMDAPKNYLQRVIFQLSSFNQGYGSATKFAQTWEQLTTELLSNDQYGAELRKKLDVPALEGKLAGISDNAEKIKTIYQFVQRQIQWNGYIGTYFPNGVKKSLESGQGSATEMNLVLLNLLQHHGIEAHPLLVAERDYGKVDVKYPFRDRFSKMAVYAKIDEKHQPWIMDASQKNLPAFVTPYQLLNTIALVVEKKEPKLIKIVRPTERFYKKIDVEATVDLAAEKIKGKVQIERHGYARYASSKRLGGMPVNPIAAVDDSRFENIDIETTQSPEPLSDIAPAIKTITYAQELPAGTGTLYYSSNLFMGLGQNPFNNTNRFTDVNFGYPIHIIQTEKIQLPPGSKLKEEFPEQMLMSDDNLIMLNRKVTLEENVLTIRTTFQQQTTLVPAAEYEPLRKYYAEMIALLGQPVVIALGQ